MPRALQWIGMMLLAVWAPAQEERLVVGVISEASPGRMVLVLDRDGYPGQRRGMPLTFAVISSTKIFEHERPAFASAIQPRRPATVRYVHGNRGTLVAREVRLLGGPRGGYTNSSAGSSVRLTEVRLQRTPRQGDAGITQVREGSEFYIAFYVRVDATALLRLEYRCMNPDFSKATKAGRSEALKPLRTCDYSETIQAGFRGIRYHAFPMKYARQGGSGGQDVIIAEVAPFIASSGSATRLWQRKLAPITIVP